MPSDNKLYLRQKKSHLNHLWQLSPSKHPPFGQPMRQHGFFVWRLLSLPTHLPSLMTWQISSCGPTSRLRYIQACTSGSWTPPPPPPPPPLLCSKLLSPHSYRKILPFWKCKVWETNDHQNYCNTCKQWIPTQRPSSELFFWINCHQRSGRFLLSLRMKILRIWLKKLTTS